MSSYRSKYIVANNPSYNQRRSQQWASISKLDCRIKNASGITSVKPRDALFQQSLQYQQRVQNICIYDCRACCGPWLDRRGRPKLANCRCRSNWHDRAMNAAAWDTMQQVPGVWSSDMEWIGRNNHLKR